MFVVYLENRVSKVSMESGLISCISNATYHIIYMTLDILMSRRSTDKTVFKMAKITVEKNNFIFMINF